MIPSTNSAHPILVHAYEGALIGAKTGAVASLGLMSFGASHIFLEIGNRAIGNEPKWPLFKADCELEQFREFLMCTDALQSPLSLTAYFIATTTACGMLIGTVAGVVKNVF